MSRDARAVSSFNTLASQYTTLVTEEDARTQTIEDLARQIQTQLELYFANPSAYPSPEELKARAEAEAEDGTVINRQDIDWTDRDALINQP